MIAMLNLPSLNHASATEKELDNIGSAIDTLKVSDTNKNFFDHILTMKEKIFVCRQEVALAAKRTMTAGHWTVLIILATLVAITVLGLRDNTLLMNFVASAMIIGTQGIIILLREMDSNRLLERKLAYESPREVFHAISQPPYYPYFSPARSRVANSDGLYRLGRETESQDKSFDIMSSAKQIS
jgi:hypothetical protein